MAREIKFRGINEFTGEFSYGYLTSDVYGHKRYIESVKGTTLYSESVRPETIGQFTGLTDKNGVEIYEGDIIKAEYYNHTGKNTIRVQEVYFDNGCFCIKTIGKETYEIETDRNNSPLFWLQHPSYVEILGNVHQNPELLK